ncbi:MAG: hypothetical protein HON64_02815, partial [Microbacteriaceae bacterium]|nr:hypothetical protein [Microbacteriaceae bacterium]
QATRLSVASHHAQRMHWAGITSVVDVGCGIGGDALAFAGVGLTVRALEADEATAALAAYNLAPLDTVEVLHRSVSDEDLEGVDALWCDPARRAGATRLHIQRTGPLRSSGSLLMHRPCLRVSNSHREWIAR